MISAKILDASGVVVSRVVVPTLEDVALSVPSGGSWVPCDHERITVALLTDGVAEALVRKFADEVAGVTTIEGCPFQVVQNGTTLDALNPTLRKISAKAAVDQAVGVARTNYLTDVPGQDYVYAMKYQEAVAYLAATAPTAADYPYLAAMGGDLSATAKQIVAARAAADVKLAALEQLRLAGKAAIEAAPADVGEINKVLDTQVSAIAAA